MRKLVTWVIAYISGKLTIIFFPSMNVEDIHFFISEIIINPIRFVLGMFCFVMTIVAFSSLIKSGIEETYRWIKKIQSPTISLAINYSCIICFYLLFTKAAFLSILFFIFSMILAISTTVLQNEPTDESNY